MAHTAQVRIAQFRGWSTTNTHAENGRSPRATSGLQPSPIGFGSSPLQSPRKPVRRRVEAPIIAGGVGGRAPHTTRRSVPPPPEDQDWDGTFGPSKAHSIFQLELD